MQIAYKLCLYDIYICIYKHIGKQNYKPTYILNQLCFVHFRGLTPSPTHRFRDRTELVITIQTHSRPPRRAREMNNIDQGGGGVLVVQASGSSLG